MPHAECQPGGRLWGVTDPLNTSGDRSNEAGEGLEGDLRGVFGPRLHAHVVSSLTEVAGYPVDDGLGRSPRHDRVDEPIAGRSDVLVGPAEASQVARVVVEPQVSRHVLLRDLPRDRGIRLE